MVRRNSSRLGGNRPRTHPALTHSIRKKPPQEPQKSPKSNEAQVVVQELRFIALRLGQARAVAITALAALWHQNADRDGEIASTIQHSIAEPLEAEIERIEAIRGRILAAKPRAAL